MHLPQLTIRRYVMVVCVLALPAVVLLDWTAFFAVLRTDWEALAILLVLGILGEWLSVSHAAGPSGGSQSITYIPVLASVLLLGEVAPVIVMLGTGGLAELLIRKKERIRAVFNLGQYALAAAIAATLYTAAGGAPLLLEEDPTAFSVGIIPFLLFALSFVAVNHLAVAGAITISEGRRFRDVWAKFVVGGFFDLIISPLGLVSAFLYIRAGGLGLIVSLLPLLFIRHAYRNTYRLEEANRDLLQALVKAIETRDPYTSGHSQRVKELAGRIARAMGLSPGTVDLIEMAALLHDIGKIDAVYTDILKKPESLSSEERRIIESHVTKGVALLQSLSSVPDDVIASVKHHHERHDGRGYPDGIAGNDIPIGARIIKVCDAVDAMLSDRPYRKALPLSVVREQLITYSGTQFHPEVVGFVISNGVLEDYARTSPEARTRSSREASPQQVGGVPSQRTSRSLAAYGRSSPAKLLD